MKIINTAVKVLSAVALSAAYIVSCITIGVILLSMFYSEAECNAALNAVIQWVKGF